VRLADSINKKYGFVGNQEIMPSEIVHFFKTGIESGFLCKKGFAEGMKKGKTDYLYSLILLFRRTTGPDEKLILKSGLDKFSLIHGLS
jgi:hypothetical protein